MSQNSRIARSKGLPSTLTRHMGKFRCSWYTSETVDFLLSYGDYRFVSYVVERFLLLDRKESSIEFPPKPLTEYLVLALQNPLGLLDHLRQCVLHLQPHAVLVVFLLNLNLLLLYLLNLGFLAIAHAINSIEKALVKDVVGRVLWLCYGIRWLVIRGNDGGVALLAWRAWLR